MVWGGINFKRMHGDFRKVAKERKSKYIMAKFWQPPCFCRGQIYISSSEYFARTIMSASIRGDNTFVWLDISIGFCRNLGSN